VTLASLQPVQSVSQVRVDGDDAAGPLLGSDVMKLDVLADLPSGRKHHWPCELGNLAST
jgi:hypothetical protein